MDKLLKRVLDLSVFGALSVICVPARWDGGDFGNILVQTALVLIALMGVLGPAMWAADEWPFALLPAFTGVASIERHPSDMIWMSAGSNHGPSGPTRPNRGITRCFWPNEKEPDSKMRMSI